MGIPRGCASGCRLLPDLAVPFSGIAERRAVVFVAEQHKRFAAVVERQRRKGARAWPRFIEFSPLLTVPSPGVRLPLLNITQVRKFTQSFRQTCAEISSAILPWRDAAPSINSTSVNTAIHGKKTALCHKTFSPTRQNR